MGTFSSKDGHGPTGPSLDLFQTPPTSPVTSTLPTLTPITPSTPGQPAAPVPVTALSPAPVTALSPAPVTALSPAPVTALSPVPVTALSPAPVTTLSPAPVTTLSPAPVPALSPAPVTSQGPAPVTAQGPAPVTAQGPAPVTAQGPAPVTAQGPAPVTAQGPAPVTAQGPAPVTAQGPAPVAALAPALSGKRLLPVSPGYSVIGPGFISLQGRTGSNAAVPEGWVVMGCNGGPTRSSPRIPVPQGKSSSMSPTKTPSSLGSSLSSASLISPVSPSGQSEKDSGLSLTTLEHHGSADNQAEIERLVEECRTALGLSPSQYATLNIPDVLKHLLVERQELTAEVQSLRETMQTERVEWNQFQSDLQVAVAVADRLRAEAEEELNTLRAAQMDTERELEAAQQRQKETDGQLVSLRGELRESRQKLVHLTQNQGPGQAQAQAKTQGMERATGETSTLETQEGTHRGRERGISRFGRGRGDDKMEKRSQEEGNKNISVKEARTDTKGVANRYLRNVTNEERSGEEGCSMRETQRKVTQERASLSRLPASSDSPAVMNGTSQSNTATIAGSINKNQSQTRGRKGLEWQDSWSSTHTGKREEALNQYNSALAELPPNTTSKTRSQDGFNLLLRRHGGSKRNSLLRWCQSRTQGYKNIDITNFSSSWADGLAFCAVYHTYLPSHIPYCTLSPDNKSENLSLAFKTGENVGITTSLTMEEMLRAGGPDWQRVLGYVECMYRHFEM
ncbi:cytospin-A-like isoform X2 [Oncorhynchus keta]|uniref:cytospin-A-like isoform X2 n=1 Tax=Oncorhynchus keta TaxID=8018 RepID=UPI002279F692|nr:cytospin-A-like isoform X2 [Oncorhynchus keta]